MPSKVPDKSKPRPYFSDLLAQLPQPPISTTNGDVAIRAPVVENAAEVERGGIFVARKGASADGHVFIPQALARGAAAVVGERAPGQLRIRVPYAQVENALETVGYLASAYYEHPSRRLYLIGVTGTDGKTTTSTFLHQILREATGGKAGLISTVAADLGTAQVDTGFHVTTPGAPQVQALLARMAEAGLTHVVLEMTSHGLAQGRLNGVEVDAALLTNLTHEHLDYHGTFEAYREAKGRLFGMLSAPRTKPYPTISVINGDDANADYFAQFPADRVIRYGLGKGNDVRADSIRYAPDGTHFRVMQPLLGDTRGAEYTIALAGEYNVRNALAAAAMAYILDDGRTPIDIPDVERGLRAVRGIPGRLERVETRAPFLALVDFAHTPNALANALRAAREMADAGGRVIVVFGCAGLRDREKRVLMPQVAIRQADVSIFTAEDPRTESLDDILAMMAAAAVEAGGTEGETFFRVRDRGQALYQAVQMAQPGDVVIACGKGHEQSMAFGTTEYAWDDRDGLRAALDGHPLRTLPTAGGDPAA